MFEGYAYNRKRNSHCICGKNIESVVEALKEKGIKFERDENAFCRGCFENGAKWAVFRGMDGERMEVNEK